MLTGGLQNAFADIIPPRVIASDIQQMGFSALLFEAPRPPIKSWAPGKTIRRGQSR
jgi:hypothetical protein